jgi:predicted RNase H-like HicB family nuclease
MAKRGSLLEQETVDSVQISFDLLCTVKQETKSRWVTGCPQLDVYSQGKTKAEAEQSLREAITVWVKNCLERGTLGAALEEVGFRRAHPAEIKPGVEHISIYSKQKTEDRADTFSVHLTIPAYQAALLSAQG